MVVAGDSNHISGWGKCMRRFINPKISRRYSALSDELEILPPVSSACIKQVILNVASICNMCCPYCFASQGAYGLSCPNFMDAEPVLVFLKRLAIKRRGIEQIKFFGGEPFLNVQCIEIICSAFHRWFACGEIVKMPFFHINTNLTLLDQAIVELIQTYNISITVGLDGPPKIHDRLRVYPDGRGSFELVDKHIIKLVTICGQPRSIEAVYTAEHARLGVLPSALHEFFGERYGERNFIIHPSVSPFMGLPALNKGKNFDDQELDKQMLYDAFFDYGRYVMMKKLCDNPALPKDGASLLKNPQIDCQCDQCLEDIFITTSGDIYPCSGFVGREEFRIGNIGDDGQGFDASLELIRGRLSNSRRSTNQTCKTCPISKTCKTCPAAMLQRNGSIHVPDGYLCTYHIGFTEGMVSGLENCSGSINLEDRGVSDDI